MTNVKLSRWLLVAIAIVGLAVALPMVSAHGNETTAGDAAPPNETADEWGPWMDDHMTQHMGAGAAEWMESQMDGTVDEMAEADHDRGPVEHDHSAVGMGGQSHC
ncbi:hypothetical protein Hrd1104_03495 [Halorhabdus sp. CBA1104]|uniref:hypothetical protein n=1 Tax=unclassified Halorhabdus TaxID=2621901 RepID=UPI0012B20C33|nr:MULTISPECIES: hypothetical protein [unclassified Halorhabdus]QGN06449.1 hypothetical protein Hrd1104_03495 [Halorhabdus sp. CBA1104]